jgi:hypothetical protein
MTRLCSQIFMSAEPSRLTLVAELLRKLLAGGETRVEQELHQIDDRRRQSSFGPPSAMF